MRYVKSLVETDGSPPRHLLEETREAGWEDEEILEAIAHVALATFGNLVTRRARSRTTGRAKTPGCSRRPDL